MSLEWSAPGIVLSALPYGEGDALAAIFTEEHGVYRGLARGGLSRARVAGWQAGNLVQARWVARLADQLGSFTAEPIHAAAASVMDDALALCILSSCCAVAEGALPEREPHPAVFRGLLHLIAHSGEGAALLPDVVRWEAGLLAALGFGLDLGRCAVTGDAHQLAYVSPRTGRAVSAEAAGLWRERLFKLPAFLTAEMTSTEEDWQDGLRLTGHFLARDAFGSHNRPLPAARVMLYDKVSKAGGTSSYTTIPLAPGIL